MLIFPGLFSDKMGRFLAGSRFLDFRFPPKGFPPSADKYPQETVRGRLERRGEAGAGERYPGDTVETRGPERPRSLERARMPEKKFMEE
jgi:hypothetical protein